MLYLGLQLVILGLVVLQDIQQEGSGFPHSVPLQKQVSHDIELNGGPRLAGHHLGQIHGSLRVVHHHALQQVHVVRLVALACAVGHQLCEVALGSQACSMTAFSRWSPAFSTCNLALNTQPEDYPACVACTNSNLSSELLLL